MVDGQVLEDRYSPLALWLLAVTVLLYSLVQQFFALGIDLKSHSIGFLVNGHGPAQEPAVLRLVRMMGPLQRPEWKLNVFAARERSGRFIENEIEDLHRTAARQPPLTQLADYITLVQGVPRPFYRRSHLHEVSASASISIPGCGITVHSLPYSFSEH